MYFILAVPVPIVELQNSGFLSQLQGLILLYDKHYAILKDELGEDPNLISQAIQPRVAVSNINTAEQAAQNATDYLFNIINDVAKDSNIFIISHKEHMNEKFTNVLKFIKHKNFFNFLFIRF